jgi:cell division protein FtsX
MRLTGRAYARSECLIRSISLAFGLASIRMHCMRIAIVALVGLALSLVGCGGSARTTTATDAHAASITVDKSPSASTCYVKVSFDSVATRKQEEAVGVKLRSDPRVKRAVFVSKEQALRLMRKKYPALVKSLPSNPLPDEWNLTPKQDHYAAVIARDLQRAHLSGVGGVAWRRDAECGT